jgi:hypothetical protein
VTLSDDKKQYSPLDEYDVDEVDFYVDLIRTELMTGNIREAERKFQEFFPSRDGLSLHIRIKEWIIDNQKTAFNTTELDKELQIVTERDKTNRRQILKRLREDGTIVSDKKIPGRWYVCQGRGRVLDWFTASEKPLDMVFPLGEESLVEIYPKNTLLYAGSWQSGKTAYFMNLAYMNRDLFNSVIYFMSEMGGPEIKKRLKKADHIDLQEFAEKITMIEQSSHFDEGLDPHGLNFIDYLSVKDNFHEVAGIIETIDDALETGVAVIAIQDYGYGGEMTGNRPRLYVALERGVAKILKGKNWKTDRSPDGLVRTYKIVNGIKFLPADDWREEYDTRQKTWG